MSVLGWPLFWRCSLHLLNALSAPKWPFALCQHLGVSLMCVYSRGACSNWVGFCMKLLVSVLLEPSLFVPPTWRAAAVRPFDWYRFVPLTGESSSTVQLAFKFIWLPFQKEPPTREWFARFAFGVHACVRLTRQIAPSLFIFPFALLSGHKSNLLFLSVFSTLQCDVTYVAGKCPSLTYVQLQIIGKWSQVTVSLTFVLYSLCC